MGEAHQVLIRQLRQGFDQRSWHGTNLWGSIRTVEEEEAARRPQAERHNIWELVVHAAYWKYRVYRLLTSEPPRNFDLRGSNFFTRPGPEGTDSWHGDRELLRAWHDRLLQAAERLDATRLPHRVGNDWFSFEDLIMGAAAHDLYHAGQIQLLKRLGAASAEMER
jgi:uncharacterized damage-inducible protein DinB